jgi:hypothetical protein
MLENTLQIRGWRQDKTWAHRAEVSRHAGMHSGSVDVARGNRVLEDQLATLRREHDDLRRTIYEAAQVQRKLCGSHLLRREPFEIASEIFPVRHLSGDFISVFELGTDLYSPSAISPARVSPPGCGSPIWWAWFGCRLRRWAILVLLCPPSIAICYSPVWSCR